MSTTKIQAEFKYSVLMRCTYPMYKTELCGAVRSIGYGVIPYSDAVRNMNYIFTRWDHQSLGWSKDIPSDMAFVHVCDFNKVLFFALISATKGDDFVPGEWAFCHDGDHGDFETGKLYQFDANQNGVRFFGGINEAGDQFRKPTLEEILKFFALPVEKIHEEPELDPNCGLSVGVRAEEPITDYSKDFEECHNCPHRDLQVESRDNPPARIGDHIKVWNGPSDKRVDAFFVSLDSNGYVIASQQNPEYLGAPFGNFTVCRYEHYAPFGQKMIIPHSEIREVFAEKYNMHPDLIDW